MRSSVIKVVLAGAVAATLSASSLLAHDNDRDGKFRVFTQLIGFQEVPAISTAAHGFFWATVDTKANTITWRLKYDGLEAPVTQSHVHLGQLSVSGGVSFFLCSNLNNGPTGTQTCPDGPADISGVITPDLVIGPAGQGIDPQSFAEIAAAMQDGVAYANVHSTKWPAGEIRGQLH
jgi:hypothetical protein